MCITTNKQLLVKLFTTLLENKNTCFHTFCVVEKAISGIARIEKCAYNG